MEFLSNNKINFYIIYEKKTIICDGFEYIILVLYDILYYEIIL